MALPTTDCGLENSKFIENANDQGVDVRTNDQIAHQKLDAVKDAILGNDPDGEVKSYWSAAASVPNGAYTTVVGLQVPVGKVFYLQFIEVSGRNVAEYTVQKGANIIARVRTHYGKLNEIIPFVQTNEQGVEFVEGDLIRVFVQHVRPTTGLFDARIVGILKDA